MMIPKGTWKKLTNKRRFGKHNNSGCYGKYYYLGKDIGVKVIFSGEDTGDHRGFNDAEILKESGIWKAARAELAILQHTALSGVTPQPYGLQPVWAKIHHYAEAWYPGIYMQHIHGKCFSDLFKEPVVKREAACNKISNRLAEKAGIKHRDAHSGNVIVQLDKNGRPSKYWLIDMTPGFITIQKKG